MKKKILLGIKVENRKKIVEQLQNTLTKFGCSIKTRVGLHDLDENTNPRDSFGIIILELTGDYLEICKLEAELLKIETVELQKMYFTVDD